MAILTDSNPMLYVLASSPTLEFMVMLSLIELSYFIFWEGFGGQGQSIRQKVVAKGCECRYRGNLRI